MTEFTLEDTKELCLLHVYNNFDNVDVTEIFFNNIYNVFYYILGIKQKNTLIIKPNSI